VRKGGGVSNNIWIEQSASGMLKVRIIKKAVWVIIYEEKSTRTSMSQQVRK